MSANDAGYPRLVGDIGGTHARFATVTRATGPVQAVVRYRCDAYASLWDALQAYLAEQAPAAPRSCALGVATAVGGDRVQLTNHPWSFSIQELQQRLGVQRLLVLNDFSALALSLPALGPEDLRAVGGGQARPGHPLALLGPGTGLGVSGLLGGADGRPVAISGEGGHVSLAPATAEEDGVVAWLRERFGHASAERALSGPGLENLHRAVCARAGWPAPPLPAPEITRRALDGSDAPCQQALMLFCSLLGGVAGNLALTLGARGGVVIGGGIVPQLGTWFDRSPFRQRFEAKGRFARYLAEIPTWVLQSEVSPALLGAARALDGPLPH